MPYSRTMVAAVTFTLVFLSVSGSPASGQETTTSTPNNDKIAFSSNRDGNYDIYTVNPDGSNPIQLTNDVYAYRQPAWSPDGTKIVTSMGHIWVMDADGSNLTNLTTNRGSFFNFGPTWLPNGEQVAFGSSGPPSQLSDIYKMNSDGSNQTNLTNTPEVDELYPDFSPDGSQRCVYRGLMTQGSGIYVMDADGSNPTRVSDERSGVGCQWSPDGSKIAFTYPVDDAGDVFVTNADGSGNTTNLTRNPAEDGVGGWSPDGTKISFTSDRDGDLELYTMKSDGSDVAQVTANSNAKDVEPNWHVVASEVPAQGDGDDTGTGQGNADGTGASQVNGGDSGNAGTGTTADDQYDDADGVILDTIPNKPLPNTGGAAILAPAVGLLLISVAVARLVVRRG